jgi:hypothetical protein
VALDPDASLCLALDDAHQLADLHRYGRNAVTPASKPRRSAGLDAAGTFDRATGAVRLLIRAASRTIELKDNYR